MHKRASLTNGILFVAGTTIGGGMLALPILTGLGGFIPSLVICLVCWLFMTATGLLFLEISLWFPKETNIISMAEATLGIGGKVFAWMLYLFLFYCLTVAYTVGCGQYILELIGLQAYPFLGPILFLAVFAPLIILGFPLISTINSFFLLAMIILYVGIIGMGIPLIQPEFLARKNWSLSLISLPIYFTAFAYQSIIPTLVHYLNRDIEKSRISILIGTLIPLICYIIWQMIILGIVPTFGPHGLAEALENGNHAVLSLQFFVQHPWLIACSRVFGFIALLTSFFGVSVGLFDFLSNGFSIPKTLLGKTILGLLVFIPPLCISFWKPDIFLKALELAGGYGCALLLGLLPILMVWKGRYILHLEAPRQLKGGKFLLGTMALFVIFEISLQIATTLGSLS